MEIRVAGPHDAEAVMAAGHLFDEPPRAEETSRFLREPGHHLLLAYEDGTPVGFASGIEVVHPDKRPEMMLYEIAVDEGHRRRGIATALVDRLSALGRERGCPSMFVFADDPDPGAQAFYAALAPARRDACVMFTWE